VLADQSAFFSEPVHGACQIFRVLLLHQFDNGVVKRGGGYACRGHVRHMQNLVRRCRQASGVNRG